MRRTSVAALAAFLMGALVMSALPSLAGDGDPIRLGQKNVGKSATKVRIKRGIVFEATRADSPAATFNVVSGAPIKVNSDAWVEDLNADLLDGKHSYQLGVQHGWKSNDNLPDATNWTTKITIHVPAGGGAAVMAGGVGWYNNTGGDYEAGCRFQVDENQAGIPYDNISGSFRADEAANGQSVSCSAEGYKQLPAGFHDIWFTTFAMGTPGIQLNEGLWWVLVVPNS